MKQRKTNTLISIKEMKEHPLYPSPELIAGGILPEKSLLLISGKQKSRKTFLAMNLAFGLASGSSFACFNIPKSKKVILLSAEGGWYSNEKRMKVMSNSIPQLSEDKLSFCFDIRFKLENPSDVQKLKDMIIQSAADVVIIDPLIKFHQLEENSAKEMGQILSVIRDLIEDCNISVILIHHQGKEGETARGSSAISGEYDSCISIKKPNQDKHTLSFELRQAPAPSDIDLKFNNTSYWFEEEDVHPLVAIVKAAGKISRKELAEKAVLNKHYKNDTGAYKPIKTLIEQKVLIVTDDDKITVGYPLSKSPGQ
jgi:archaellum biogenesis ATPase FlaH